MKFRDLTMEDLDSLVRWRNDPVVTRHLSNRMQLREEAEAWFHKLKANPKIWLKVIIEDGQTIGYAGVESIDEKNRKCELVLVIGESDYWGKGIGKSVLMTMLEYAFDTLHMHRVWAVTARGNDRSERLLKKAGFMQEGIMRETIIIGERFTDLLCYSILEHEYKLI
ncbi:MAG: GNAT family N-acetyltransferase [FCB group bacterium]|nr:GNAT family N-acetyltransferase [FCB group bacterium]